MISIPGRIPIHIFPFFWLLIAMIGWLNSESILGTSIWATVIFVSVLFHEFGHALTARFFGQEAEISLVGLGGVTKRQGPKLSHWKDFLVVLNGPLAGFLLFFITYFLFSFVEENKHPILFYALEVSVNVNLFWTILNLVPVLPLDGGQLLRILLEGWLGLRGLKMAFLTSLILAGCISLFFFINQQVLVGALFIMLAFESYRAWADMKDVAPEDSDQQLQQLVKEGVDLLKQGQLQPALDNFKKVRDQAPKGVIYVTATQYMARILADQGYYKQAYEALAPLKNRLSIDYLRLLHQLAYRIQEWEEAAKIGQELYQKQPAADTALLNALCYAIKGEAIPCVGWLRSAIQAGLPDPQQVIQRREFDVVRSSPAFQKLVKDD